MLEKDFTVAVTCEAIIRLLCGGNAGSGFILTPQRERVIRVLREQSWNWDLAAHVIKWAANEYLNVGSYQRIQLPFELHGSGRWLASDCGGDYGLLMRVVVAAIDTVLSNKHDSDYYIRKLRLLCVAQNAKPSECIGSMFLSLSEKFLEQMEKKREEEKRKEEKEKEE